LRAERFDLCVICSGLLVGVVGGWRGEEICGGRGAARGLAKWLYPERVKVAGVHVVEQACSELGAAAGETLRPATVPFPVDETAEGWCDRVVKPERSCGDGSGGGWGAKEWPAERYGAVARGWLGRVCGAGDAVGLGDKAAEAVERSSEGAAVAVPCSVGQMIALMRRAALAIGGDTDRCTWRWRWSGRWWRFMADESGEERAVLEWMVAKGRVLRDARV